ncbi:hypothetical protein FB451DRAFT_1222981 [Mycena latifolia]|nr:hypothetical protein FB451DRAFT_1222981 [Mycena latifolia]
MAPAAARSVSFFFLYAYPGLYIHPVQSAQFVRAPTYASYPSCSPAAYSSSRGPPHPVQHKAHPSILSSWCAASSPYAPRPHSSLQEVPGSRYAGMDVA